MLIIQFLNERNMKMKVYDENSVVFTDEYIRPWNYKWCNME